MLLLKLQNQKLFHASSLIMDRAYPSTKVHVNREEDGSCKWHLEFSTANVHSKAVLISDIIYI
jgi:exoribonuclease II